MEDTELLLYLVDTMREEPFLIAYLVRAGTCTQPFSRFG